MEANLAWLKDIPATELVKRSVLPKIIDKVEQLRSVLAFYGVSSVDAWHDVWGTPAVAARRSLCFESCPGSASAWIRMGEIEAHSMECAEYSKKKFQAAIQEIRKLTVQDAQVFAKKMQALCAEAGVALAFVPEMKKVPWFGATKWLSPTKAMIILNLRGKTEDLFWFAFFHEAGHVLNDGKKHLFINTGKLKQEDPKEINANEFAADLLIPKRYNDEILAATSKKKIKAIAKKLEISSGIVVGRYQFLTKKWHVFNDLKGRLEWA